MAQHMRATQPQRAISPLVLACVAAFATFAVCSTWYFSLPWQCGPLMLLMQVGGTFCMGRLLLRALGMDEHLATCDALALSYTLGYGVSLVLYVVLFVIGAQAWIGPVYLAVSALSLLACAILQLRGGRLVKADDSLSGLSKLILILLAVYALVFMLPNYLPTAQTNGYYLDNMFWVGNNVELTYSVPPDNFRNVLAPNIRYHYLSSIRMALVQTVLGIPALEACFAYSALDLVVLLASSAIMFAREFASDKNEGFPVALAAFLLLFSTGAERLTSMSFLSHLYIASFGFVESFAAMLVFLALAKRHWEQGQLAPQEAFVSSTVIALCMGHKGTLGFVCLLATFVLCITALFQPRRRQFALLFGLTALVAGLAVYFGLLSEGIWRNMGDVTNVRSLLSFPRVETLHNLLCASPMPKPLGEALFLAIYTFASHPLCWACGAIALAQIIRMRTFDALDAALLLASLACVAILRLVPMKGFSQSYFYMAAIPLVWALAFRRLQFSHDAFATLTRRLVVAGIVTACSLVLCYQAWLPKQAVKGVLHAAGIIVPESLSVSSGFNDNAVTPQAYDALVWVRDNLPREAIYYTEIHAGNASNVYFAGAISERHVLRQWNLFGVEATEDVPLLFSGDEQALAQCRVDDVAYAIQLDDPTHVEELLPSNVTLLYRTGDSSVYKITG